MFMKIVTAKELKNRTGEVLRRVRAGETVAVTVRGVRVAQFVPLPQDGRGRGAREGRKSRKSMVRLVAGKYRGLGTVEEFLKDKDRESALER